MVGKRITETAREILDSLSRLSGSLEQVNELIVLMVNSHDSLLSNFL